MVRHCAEDGQALEEKEKEVDGKKGGVHLSMGSPASGVVRQCGEDGLRSHFDPGQP